MDKTLVCPHCKRSFETSVVNYKEHKILKDGVVGMTKLMHDNQKYFNYDKEKLEMLVTMYHDALEHINVFCIEAIDSKNGT